jgi:hypothetical protein
MYINQCGCKERLVSSWEDGEKSWRMLEAIPQRCMCKCSVSRWSTCTPINSLYLHDKLALLKGHPTQKNILAAFSCQAMSTDECTKMAYHISSIWFSESLVEVTNQSTCNAPCWEKCYAIIFCFTRSDCLFGVNSSACLRKNVYVVHEYCFRRMPHFCIGLSRTFPHHVLVIPSALAKSVPRRGNIWQKKQTQKEMLQTSNLTQYCGA